jgi:hypothetical protein
MISSDLHSRQRVRRTRLACLAFAVTVCVIFLMANRGAYRGFFTNDDFENTANAQGTPLSYYGAALLRSNFDGRTTFRPIAALYYFAMVRLAGLHFEAYVIGIQILHLLNVVLIWMLARTLGAERAGAAAAAMLFAMSAIVYLVYWEPMYVFDLICGTFCLLCILAYARGGLILSLVLFWLALKAKEVAIVIPVVLAGYEWWFGGKRWKRLIPFFGIAAILVTQALVFNARRDDAYSLRFTPQAVWKCARFYAAALVPGPGVWRYAGFLILALPFFIRDRRVRFGIFSFVCLLGLMLFLPGRLVDAYLYIPLIGLAIALSGGGARAAWLAAFLVVWIPWSYHQTRAERSHELAAAGDRRIWFETAAKLVRDHADVDTLVYNDPPGGLYDWGVDGMLRNLRPDSSPIGILDRSPEYAAGLQKPHLALLVWDGELHKLFVVPRAPDVSYIRLSLLEPEWQFGEGWLGNGSERRWIGPQATARLLRPASARRFEVVAWVPKIYVETFHQGRLDIFLDHQLLGTGILDKPDWHTFRFDAPAAQPGPAEVEFRVDPALKDPKGSSLRYGTLVGAFGFLP